jgi:hypothetical protein
VLRRSTTDWTWLRLFRSVARSIVAFIARYAPVKTKLRQPL